MDMENLIARAKLARLKAYVPYSKFKVGEALLTKKGKIFTGCHVENASLSLSICAERVALFKAVSEGEKEFLAIAIVSEDKFCPPCGSCRQVLSEFGLKTKVIMADLEGRYEVKTIKELLPQGFKRRSSVISHRSSVRSGKLKVRS